MKVEIKVKYLIIVILGVLLMIWALLAMSGYNSRLKVDKANIMVLSKRDSIVSYQIEVAGLKEQVYQSNLTVVSRDDDIFKLKEEKDRLKELNIKSINLIGNLKVRVSLLEDSIKPLIPAVPIEDVNEAVKYVLPLPNKFTYKDKYVSVFTKIDKIGLAEQGFLLTDPKFNIVVGRRGNGVFAKRGDVAIVTTDNPYINIQESNIVLVNKNPKPLTYMAVGSGLTIVAVVVAKILLSD